ncbi:hypothetical protein Vretimale_10362 [Volvox reticuliferus]|uniref:Protein kinase domain-containing protein n=1 Tax=Volvox reticuliferus TaxID=1737510 RepID=A0A8J4GF76_9CHLO|nr:hypothetical protein Vretimale_10362 [Volvox reticuliferus]
MGGCGSKSVAVGSEGNDTADSAASLSGRPPSAGSSIRPSSGSQLRTAAKTAWQTSARNLQNSLNLSRRRQESHHRRSSKNTTPSDVEEEEIDSAGRGGRPDCNSRRRPSTSAAMAAGGSVAWQPASADFRSPSGQGDKYVVDTVKAEGAGRGEIVGKPCEDIELGDSYVRSFHVRNQATDSMDEGDEEESEPARRKESRETSFEGSQLRQKAGGCGGSSSACSGVLSPSSAMSPASGTADSDAWSVAGGNSRVPRNSCPAGTAGPVTGTSPATIGDVSNRQPADGGGWTEPPSGGATAALPPPPLGGVPTDTAQALPCAPSVPGAATAAPEAEAALATAAAAASAAAAVAASAAGAPPVETVQWVVRPGPPVESAYVLGEILGKGSFGVVRAATHLATGAKVAVKTIRKSLLGAADVSALRREVEILHHLSGHPHISQLLGVYEEPSQLHLVLELYQGGDLFDAIIAGGRHSERAAADVMRTVLTAISYCHAMGVAHRDVKPENFMLTAPVPPGTCAAAGSRRRPRRPPWPEPNHELSVNKCRTIWRQRSSLIF